MDLLRGPALDLPQHPVELGGGAATRLGEQLDPRLRGQCRASAQQRRGDGGRDRLGARLRSRAAGADHGRTCQVRREAGALARLHPIQVHESLPRARVPRATAYRDTVDTLLLLYSARQGRSPRRGTVLTIRPADTENGQERSETTSRAAASIWATGADPTPSIERTCRSA